MNKLFLKELNGQKIELRYSQADDDVYLKEWLSEPEAAKGFPIDGEMELDDAVVRWLVFYRLQASLTILVDDRPAGIATLYLQPYGRLVHQCEFGIVVSKEYRGKKIGRYLLKSLICLAKEKFKIEVLHLQVYAENRAVEFYKKFGFKEFGRQERWAKENGQPLARLLMEKIL